MDPVDKLLEEVKAGRPGPRLPEATYRLQFHRDFTFRDAARITPYLRDLGITHCYASPYLRARPGSTHGYDIIDHNSLNPEIGSLGDYDAWVRGLREAGLSQILDMVPNHMGVATNDNAWWNDVLENGPASRHGAYFDIAWRASPRPELQDKVLLPVLGDPYGDVLESGQLQLCFENGVFAIAYYDRRFPVAGRSYARILAHRLPELEASLGPESPALLEYQSIVTASRNLPNRSETDPERVAERWREKEVIKRRLAALAAESDPVREFIAQNVAIFNGRVGDPDSFALLDDLLEHECFRLAYWRVAPDEINYRRFFDINDLAALSMERQEVFDAAHGLVLRLLAEGKIDGLRIDHPDGLYDPGQYFLRLQEAFLLALARNGWDADESLTGMNWAELEGPLRERIRAELGAGNGPGRWPLYVVAEKILGAEEALPEGWAVHGTSGYDFLNMVNGLLVDGANADAFTRLYHDLVGDDTRYAELVYQMKLLVLSVPLASELHMLTHQLDRLAQKSRKSRDFTFNTLRRALRAIIASFPVYRSYIDDTGVHDADRRYVLTAVRRAIVRNPVLARRVFRFIRDMLLLEYPPSFSEEDRAEQRRFAGKFQQVTAPVTAKGIEDTAFYVYNRLVALNEVGGEPNRFGTRPEAVHQYFAERRARWPYAFSSLSTHDTKRSEDARARLDVLSEMPDAWHAAVTRWRRLNEPHRRPVEDGTAPDPNEEYLFYQTLIGAWPLEPYTPAEYAAFVQRIQVSMAKALHEAKVHTSWINPNDEYDKAVEEFIAALLDERASQEFLEELGRFRRLVAHYGLYNSLSQTLLKITAPGVPDTYQGMELWDFSLVDPDNRRPVDYGRRAAMLRDLQATAVGPDLREAARSLVQTKEDGRIKLYLTYRALHCRRDRPGLFSAGEYQPLAATGERTDHVFAFARRDGERRAVVAVPRLFTRLAPDVSKPPLGADVWRDTQIALDDADAALRWRNVFTGELLAPVEHARARSFAAADLFQHFPVALLIGEQTG